MTLVVDNIGLLVTADIGSGEGPLGVRHDAAVVIEGDRVVAIERAGHVAADIRLDAQGRCVIPGFVDSHTHLVFAGDRGDEFVARMAGRPYEAGGINVTVAATRAASDDDLLDAATARRNELFASGVTTVETKSGYGLTVADEQRLLSLSAQVADDVTFLGAHAVPAEYASRRDDYVALVCGAMLEACAPLAQWADVFCENGAFDVDEARAVLTAAAARGLGLRVHANQLGHGPGIRLGCELGAASVDHCTFIDAADLDVLAGSATVATFLPASDFCTRSPYPDGRRAIDAGVTVALATNCNPGTSNTTSMAFVIALAVRELRLTIEEAVLAATVGGAAALRRPDVGRIGPGTRGDLVILDAPSYTHLAYRPGVPLVQRVVCGGRVVV